jgi:hypothetical protein
VLGRGYTQDQAPGVRGKIGYDAIGKFGAGNLYDDGVAFAYVHTIDEGVAPSLRSSPRRPRWATLQASNKPAEHFTGNIAVRIVVAQLAGQTQPNNLKHLISRSLVLRPGSQSLGGR